MIAAAVSQPQQRAFGPFRTSFYPILFSMPLQFYRRPDFVAKLPGPLDLAQCQAYVERTQKHRSAIPSQLSFENVIQNKALPVSQVRGDHLPRAKSSSHAAWMILCNTWCMSAMMLKTSNSGYGFRIISRGSLPSRVSNRRSRRHGIQTTSLRHPQKYTIIPRRLSVNQS